MKRQVRCINQDRHGLLKTGQGYEVLGEYQGYNNKQYRIMCEHAFEYYFDDYLFIEVG